MNKNILILLVAIIAVSGGYFLLNKKPIDNDMGNPTAMVDTSHSETNDVMVQKEQTESDKMIADSSSKGQYVSYTPDYLTKYQGKIKVLFFHASWCPTCKIADRDINKNLDNIPENLVIIKTDYDKESELKKKYGITYQHTFVIIDEEGNEVTKWNGGSFQDILRKI